MPEDDISKFIEIYTKTPEKISVQTTTTQFEEAKIIVPYCHQILSLSGANITITANGPTVGISVGKGYDTSPQESETIVY